MGNAALVKEASQHFAHLRFPQFVGEVDAHWLLHFIVIGTSNSSTLTVVVTCLSHQLVLHNMCLYGHIRGCALGSCCLLGRRHVT